MTISSTTNRVNYTGNGVTLAFAVAFPFRSAPNLIVLSTVIATGVQTVKTITTHYTISGTPDALGHYSNGGSVDFIVAPASTERITIYRDPARTQSLDLVENDNLPAENVEASFDYLTMLLQRVSDLIGRSLRQPDGDSANIATIPSTVDRLGKYLFFDATTGDPTAVDAVDETVTPIPNTTWTPVVTAATPGDLSVVYAYQEGQVVKIGPFVMLMAQLIFTPTFTTASGVITITGAPYTHVGNTEPVGAATVVARNTIVPSYVIAPKGDGTLQLLGASVDTGNNDVVYGTFPITGFTSGVEQRISFTVPLFTA